MKKLTILFAVFALVWGMQACTKKEAPKGEAPAAKEGTAPKKDDSAAAPEKKAAEPSAAGQIGVEECDLYITKVQDCLSDKVPDAAKAQLKTSFDQTITAWKQAAATPAGKSALATGCQQALAAAKTSMGAFGCEF